MDFALSWHQKVYYFSYFSCSIYYTTYGYANSQIANLQTQQLTDWTTRGWPAVVDVVFSNMMMWT